MIPMRANANASKWYEELMIVPLPLQVIVLFQQQDGVGVCLYCIYVQEYGEDCPSPNQCAPTYLASLVSNLVVPCLHTIESAGSVIHHAEEHADGCLCPCI